MTRPMTVAPFVFHTICVILSYITVCEGNKKFKVAGYSINTPLYSGGIGYASEDLEPGGAPVAPPLSTSMGSLL